MIATQEEAEKHALHITTKSYVNVIVLPDGCIYADDSSEKLQKVVYSNDCFIVKGDIVKTVKAKKIKEKE